VHHVIISFRRPRPPVPHGRTSRRASPPATRRRHHDTRRRPARQGGRIYLERIEPLTTLNQHTAPPRRSGGIGRRAGFKIPSYPESTYDTSRNCLGRALGALAAEIAQDAPDLADVLTAWPALPEAIRAAIVAMVKASGIDRGKP